MLAGLTSKRLPFRGVFTSLVRSLPCVLIVRPLGPVVEHGHIGLHAHVLEQGPYHFQPGPEPSLALEIMAQTVATGDNEHAVGTFLDGLGDQVCR